MLSEPTISGEVGGVFEVLAAVALDDEPMSQANEIGDVFANHYLAPVAAVELFTSQCSPQDGLGLCEAAT